MKRTNREFYGQLGVKNLPSAVIVLWNSRDDELPDSPSYQMSCEFESDADWYEKKDFVLKLFGIDGNSPITEREAFVLRLLIIDGLTLEETGKEIGVVRERARQISLKALRKLRRRAVILLKEKHETHHQ